MRVNRRELLVGSGVGVVAWLNGCAYAPVSREEQEAARAANLGDGRPRLPPGQELIARLKDMGGDRGDPDPARLELRITGRVRRPMTLTFGDLLEMDAVEQVADVHCVTGWSVFDGVWRGVRVRDLAERSGMLDSARHVVFEAAGVYTANVPLDEALRDNVLVTWELDGAPLSHTHGGPVRNLVPDLYFWKSAKWLTGIRFVDEDEPGYWEVRGYHNHGDPWMEERFA